MEGKMILLVSECLLLQELAWKLSESSSKNTSFNHRPDVTLQTFKIVVSNLYQSVDMKIFPVVIKILRAA